MKDFDFTNISDKIEILSTDDAKMQKLGEIMSNESSRIILKLLFEDNMTANQISQKTEMLLSLVIYHLNKMTEIGIVKIVKIEKNRKEHDMKYYGTSKFAVIILPSKSIDKAKKSKSLYNSLKKISGFVAIGMAAVISWLVTYIVTQSSINPPLLSPIKTPEIDSYAMLMSIITIIVGLIIKKIFHEYDKKKLQSMQV
jgi:hypothetical protein